MCTSRLPLAIVMGVPPHVAPKIELGICSGICVLSSPGAWCHVSQGYELKGFLDSPRSDPAMLSNELNHFRLILERLFLRGDVVRVGYTAHMLSWLQKRGPVLIPASLSGEPQDRTLGGPRSIRPADIDFCLAHLRSFTSMALATLSAEFPSWEVLQCYSVFALTKSSVHEVPRAASGHERDAKVALKLQRLARLANVDASELHEEYLRTFPLAVHHLDHAPKISNIEAWRQAVQGRRRNKLGRPQSIGALLPVLQRYVAMTACSTQGQEAAFSTQERLLLHGAIIWSLVRKPMN